MCREENGQPFGHLCAKIVIVGSSKWVKNYRFFAHLLNYLTVLVYTKTIIYLSVGG